MGTRALSLSCDKVTEDGNELSSRHSFRGQARNMEAGPEETEAAPAPRCCRRNASIAVDRAREEDELITSPFLRPGGRGNRKRSLCLASSLSRPS